MSVPAALVDAVAQTRTLRSQGGGEAAGACTLVSVRDNRVDRGGVFAGLDRRPRCRPMILSLPVSRTTM